MTAGFCPFYGSNPPCYRCAMLLQKRDRYFCAFAWQARKGDQGMGKDGKADGHNFAPWIVNDCKGVLNGDW